jgi:ubiquitin-protein ligase
MGSELPAAAPPQPKRSTAAAAVASRRIGRELWQFWLDPPPYCRPGPSPVKDHFHWEVVIDGPAATPYAGGVFPVDVWFPYDYPFRPPKLFFKTKVIACVIYAFLDLLRDPRLLMFIASSR